MITTKTIFSIILVIFLTGVIILPGCRRDYAPKPRGFFRIDLPEKAYRPFDSAFPYSFEIPVYAKIQPDEKSPGEPYWINIDFPQFKGRIHISYKKVENNLVKYLEDSRSLVIKHIPKADAISDSLIFRPENKVFGLIYDIEGSRAASPCQFILTDSTTHFLRGALYFNVTPNNDSLAPVIDFIRVDILHMIETLRWK